MMLVKRALGLALVGSLGGLGLAGPGGAVESRPAVFSGRSLAAGVTVSFDVPNFLPVSPLFLGGAGRAVGEISQSPPQKSRGAALDFGDVVPTAPGLVELLGGAYPAPLPRDYGKAWMATALYPERPVEDTHLPTAGGADQPFSAEMMYGHAEAGGDSAASTTAVSSFRLLPGAMPGQAAGPYQALLLDLRQGLAAVPGVNLAALPAESGALVEVDHAASSQDVALDGGGTLASHAKTVMQGLKLAGGVLQIDQLEATSTAKNGVSGPSGEAMGTMSGVTLAGQAARITRHGIEVADNQLGEGSGDQIEKAFNDAMAANGFSLAFDKTAQSLEPGLVGASWTGLSLTQTVADFPPGFSTVYRFDFGSVASRLSLEVTAPAQALDSGAPASAGADGATTTPASANPATTTFGAGPLAPIGAAGPAEGAQLPQTFTGAGTEPLSSPPDAFAGGAGDPLAGIDAGTGRPAGGVASGRMVPAAASFLAATDGLGDTRAVSDELRWAAMAALAAVIFTMGATARLRLSNRR